MQNRASEEPELFFYWAKRNHRRLCDSDLVITVGAHILIDLHGECTHGAYGRTYGLCSEVVCVCVSVCMCIWHAVCSCWSVVYSKAFVDTDGMLHCCRNSHWMHCHTVVVSRFNRMHKWCNTLNCPIKFKPLNSNCNQMAKSVLPSIHSLCLSWMRFWKWTFDVIKRNASKMHSFVAIALNGDGRDFSALTAIENQLFHAI